MHSHIVLLFLALTITLISGNNLYQLDDQNHLNDEQRDINHLNDEWNQLGRLQELYKLIQNERNNQREYDRYQAIAKRAKSIVKGDPREFMG